MATTQRKLSHDEQEKKHFDTLDETGFWGKQGAGCIFLARSTGRLMISHRSRHVQEPDTWGTWGGAMDEGETDPSRSVLREVKEESGYAGKVDLVPLSVFTDAKSGFRYSNFLAIIDKEFKPKMDWENQGFRWLEFGEWPSPLHKGLALMLKQSKNLKVIKAEIDKVNPITSSLNTIGLSRITARVNARLSSLRG